MERSEHPPSCGALWGREGGTEHRALHGLEARYTFISMTIIDITSHDKNVMLIANEMQN